MSPAFSASSDWAGPTALQESAGPIRRLLHFAARASRYYSLQTWAIRARTGEPIDLADIPVTPKGKVRANPEDFYVAAIPAAHGAIVPRYTSGTEGAPLKILKSERCLEAEGRDQNLLAGAWNLSAHKCSVFTKNPSAEKPFGSTETVRLGDRRLHFVFGLEVDFVLRKILELGPTALHTWPSVARGVLGLARAKGVRLSLRLITTRSETVSDDLRRLATDHFGCELLDVYGSHECAVIAIECRRCRNYHVPGKSCVVEALRDDGAPAKPGETARVVLTPLFNYAMPLIRYDIEDSVIVASPDESCTSNLSFKKVLGREKDLFYSRDGLKFAPTLDAERMHGFKIARFKLVQKSLSEVELLYVAHPDASGIDETAIREYLRTALPANFTLTLCRVAAIAPRTSGKHTMHERLF